MAKNKQDFRTRIPWLLALLMAVDKTKSEERVRRARKKQRIGCQNKRNGWKKSGHVRRMAPQVASLLSCFVPVFSHFIIIFLFMQSRSIFLIPRLSVYPLAWLTCLSSKGLFSFIYFDYLA